MHITLEFSNVQLLHQYCVLYWQYSSISKVEVLIYEYRYNIISNNIIPVLVIASWIFGWFTIHLFTFYVLFLTLVSLTFHNSNFDKRVITYSIAYININIIEHRSLNLSLHQTSVNWSIVYRVPFAFLLVYLTCTW